VGSKRLSLYNELQGTMLTNLMRLWQPSRNTLSGGKRRQRGQGHTQGWGGAVKKRVQGKKRGVQRCQGKTHLRQKGRKKRFPARRRARMGGEGSNRRFGGASSTSCLVIHETVEPIPDVRKRKKKKLVDWSLGKKNLPVSRKSPRETAQEPQSSGREKDGEAETFCPREKARGKTPTIEGERSLRSSLK